MGEMAEMELDRLFDSWDDLGDGYRGSQTLEEYCEGLSLSHLTALRTYFIKRHDRGYADVVSLFIEQAMEELADDFEDL